MTDHSLARADEVLTELVELVETARTLPMSSSCVLPRERTLDLLDALREVLPPEMIEARRLVAEQDELRQGAAAEAERLVTDARARAEELLTAARIQAHELVESAQAEQAELVASSTVYQVAQREAAELREQAAAELAAEHAAQLAAASKLTADAQQYAEATLGDLVQTLQRLSGTAENGLAALRERRPPQG